MRILLTIVTFILSGVLILSQGINESVILKILNLVIAFICSIALFSYQNRPYSLNKIFHIFTLFFLCIAPMIQYKNGVRILETIFEEGDYIKTSLYILAILILYNVRYNICNKNIILKEKRKKYTIDYKKLNIKQELMFIFFSSFICLFFLYINKFNLYSLFFRGEGAINVDRVTMLKTTYLLTNYFMRPIVMFLFLLACIVGVTHKRVLWILFLLLFIAAPPTGMARFSAAAIYLPLILWHFKFLRKKNIFNLSFIFGLLFIFPLLDFFRTNKVSFTQFETMNFDSYSMFMRILYFTRSIFVHPHYPTIEN